KDFSPMAQNDNKQILDSIKMHSKPCTHTDLVENQDSSQNAPLRPAPTQAVKNQDSKNLAPFKAEDLKDSDYNYITANAKNLIAAWQTK
ncbi:MAG: hypothetical protein MSS67_06910, partial [Helicobacter bilis]|nr:hypothetical protein [Helicobacter bilis]